MICSNFMPHLSTVKLQSQTLLKNYEKILNSKYRFAVISGAKIIYYYDLEQVYGDFPSLYPDARIVCGTKPLLVDISAETDSLEYKIEKNLEELDKHCSVLRRSNEKIRELKLERKKLMEKKI